MAGTSTTRFGHLYRSSAWKKASRQFLASNPQCAKCERKATVTDHKVPHRGDLKLFWSPSNWRALCWSCHSGKTRGDEYNSRHGKNRPRYAKGCDASGLPLDLAHPWRQAAKARE